MNPIEVFIPYRQMRRRMYALLHPPDTEDDVATPRKDEESGKGGGEVSTREVVGKDKWKKALTEWKKGELDKLSSVAIVAALVASVIASILVGSAILSWPVRALCLSALLFDLTSLFIAVLQTMMITSITYDPDAVARLRHSLCHPMSHMPNGWPHAQERFKPHMLAVCFWNITAILLTVAISLFVIGFNIWIFQAAVREPTWGDDRKIAVFFGVLATFVVAIYLMCFVVRFALVGPRPPKAIEELNLD